MAVWIAKMVGAEIFATVGSADKKQLLINYFGIPEDHIFYSRNTSFAKGVMRVTKGRGVDVILNSLSGDSLRVSWECVAPYGHFIEIGKADITANSSLPMGGFARNVTFAAVDLYHVAKSDGELLGRLISDIMSLLKKGHVQSPHPLNVYPVSQVEQSFRYIQSGKNSGRIIITTHHSDIVPKYILERRTWTFDKNASYLIAGGLGGLGRAIIKWMACKGARNLIVLSRSGTTKSQAALDTVLELRKLDVRVEVYKCDVASVVSLTEVLKICVSTMPPIKGCINAAMSLQDAIFDNMTHTQWELTIRSKVQSSWNLHAQLPKSMDFFILLSSLSGVYGNIAQSNYAAGCAFQDALARYRVQHGQKAISLDIGWMRNIGIIAETESYQRQRKNTADMGQIEDTELMALLEIYCDPNLPLLPPHKSQLFIGVITPASFLSRGESPPLILNRPLFKGFAHAAGGEVHAAGDGATADPTTLFRQASTSEERIGAVILGLKTRLARALSISPDDIESSKPLSDYGVDSLMAVELRNWFSKDFQASVAVFDIMGDAPIVAIGKLVAERSEIGKTQQQLLDGVEINDP